MAGRAINLGRDCRLSSPRLHDALLEGLLSTGCDVTDVGVGPTPLLYYSAVHLKADGAVMITGSHNPSEFNGFKTVCGSGTIYGDQIQEVLRIIEGRDFETGAGRYREFDAATPYIEEVAKQFKFDRRIKSGGRCRQWNGGAGNAPVVRTSQLRCDGTVL